MDEGPRVNDVVDKVWLDMYKFVEDIFDVPSLLEDIVNYANVDSLKEFVRCTLLAFNTASVLRKRCIEWV